MTGCVKWKDELLAQELKPICNGLGRFPTFAELRQLGRNDLGCAITRAGGLIPWAKKLGYDRIHSDSDFGWEGEKEVIEILNLKGFKAIKADTVKSPFDILVDDIVRIDVKTAKYTEYGASTGWFYRLGKTVQSDLVILYQIDTKEAIILPWNICPTSNITISVGGGKYKEWIGRWDYVGIVSQALKNIYPNIQKS